MMESVHKSSSRPWISEKISVKQFRDDIYKAVAFPIHDTKEVFNLNAEEYEELENQCGLDAMKCEYQHLLDISKHLEIPEGVKLDTLKYQLKDLIRRQEDSVYESSVYANSKYNAYPLQVSFSEIDTMNEASKTFCPVSEPEVILTVQVFKPEAKSNSLLKNSLSRIPNFHVDQEFMVLGCQFLTELRDKIICVSDKAIPGDYSEAPHMPIQEICEEVYKSGLFYIDGVFYNDMRNAYCRDYSKTIIDWAEKKGKEIGPFRKASMENTTFMDLTVQLGYPYLYLHQGYCEHLIVFTDLIKFSSLYNPNKNAYPLRVGLRPKKRVFCMVCRIHTAEWVVYNNKRVPENPFWFCKKCFLKYNYDDQQRKIDDFEAYHAIDRSIIL